MAPAKPDLKTNPFAPRQYGELFKVTDRVYIFRNITNSSFVIGDRSVAVIDTQVNLPTAERLLSMIRSVTHKPIEFVINTHYHWDHTNGNRLFKDQGATIISSKLTKKYMIDRAPRQKEFLAGRGFELGDDPFLPDALFEGETDIDLGHMPLPLFFAGSAETDDATAIHIPSEKVIMSGDTVMTGSFPIFGQPVWDEGLEGNERWIQTINKLLSLNPAHIVPGHGPLAHEAELDLLMKIERYFIDEVKALVSKGYPVDQVLKDLEPRMPRWITELPLVWGTPRYAILRVFRGLTKKAADKELGWQQYKPSAIPQSDKGLVNQKVHGKETFNEFLQVAHEAEEGGDHALKLSILEKAAQKFADSPDALAVYADALIEASRAEASVLEKGDFFQLARLCWERALEMNPAHIGSLLGKGRYMTMMAYRGGDDPKPGMNLLKKIIDQNIQGRERTEAEFYLGIGFRRLGDEASALAQFKKALRFDPAFMPAHLASQ